MRTSAIACLALILGVASAAAQGPTTCRVLCTPEFKVEPTLTVSNLFGGQSQARLSILKPG